MSMELQPGEAIPVAAGMRSRGVFRPRTFARWAEAEAWLRQQEAEGLNCWYTPNPVREDSPAKPRDVDVSRPIWQLVDIDPLKGADLEDARAEGRALAERLYGDLLCRACLVFSGRGYQVLIRVAEDVDRVRLADFIQREYAKGLEHVEIDSGVGQDPSRLCRVPGFINPRTGELAEVLAEPEPGEVTAAEVEAWHPHYVPRAEVEPCGWDDSEPTPEDMAAMQAVHSAWEIWVDEDNRRYKGDASARAYGFTCDLLRAGLEPEQVCRLAVHMPGDNKLDKVRDPERYWGRCLYVPAREKIEAGADEMSAVVAGLQSDDAAERERAAFGAVPMAAKLGLVEYAELRRHVRTSPGVSLSDWEAAVKRAKSAARKEALKATPPPDEHALRLVTEETHGRLVRWVKASDGGELAGGEVIGYLSSKLGGDDVARAARSAAIEHSWVMVSEPFQPRRLEGRRWNVSRAQHIDPEPGDWDEWKLRLGVIGRGLDDAVRASAWCAANGIKTGGDYLTCWLAFMFQRPSLRVPWLMLYSVANKTGKSLFHEAVRGLFYRGRGAVSLNNWLTNERGFNGEVVGAVLGYVEEENVAKQRQLFAGRMKQIITSPWLMFEAKGGQPVELPNYLHVIQCCNDPRYLVIEDTDTRITAWEMAGIRPEERGDKDAIKAAMQRQGPAFLAMLLDYPLPDHGDGRLAMPALATELKEAQGKASRDALQRFLADRPEWITWDVATLHERFLISLPASESPRAWPVGKVESALDKQPKGLRSAWRLASALRGLDSFEGSASDLAAATGLSWSPQRVGLAAKTLAEVSPGLTLEAQGGHRGQLIRWSGAAAGRPAAG